MALTAPLLSRKRVIQVKMEADKGDILITTPDDAIAFDLEISPTAPFEERKGTGKFLGHTSPGILGELSATCSFSLEVRGDGGSGADDALETLLQCCGLAKTGEVYKPTSAISTQKTCTILVFEDGIRKALHGCMGNVQFEGEFGKRCFARFTMSGVWNAPVDAAMPTYAPGSDVPMKLADGTFTLAGESIKVSRFSLDMGCNVVARADPDAAGGITYFAITDIDPVITIDPEADLIGPPGYDYHGAWLAGTEVALSLALGAVAEQTITIAAPKLQYRELTGGDRDGIAIYNLTGQCNNDSAGDDAVTITVS